jgi:ABC-type bacteriocin/lantibiotic exporter with double-glycine peptidase domain
MVSQLPDGYSTRVAERGAQFSGGQKQLIAMTRAIFGEHKTHFIFDEPTSNLDPATEQSLIQNLARHLDGRTVFYVTHRPAPLQMATHVMILEKSKIVAFGPKDQVLDALRKSSQGSVEVASS